MLTKEQYIEFIISTPVNYTATHLAAHISDLSHDSVSDFLRNERITPKSVWEAAKTLINDIPESYLIVDDSVQEKPHAQAIELVDYHYSGNKHDVVRGIDIVNLVHSSGDGNYFPIDYRIYARSYDKQTKNDHFLAMLKSAFEVRNIQAKYVLFDSWYARIDNLKYIHNQGRFFVTTLKVNRLVSLSPDTGYIHLETIDWTPDRRRFGVRIKLKDIPFYMQLFKVVAKNGDIAWLITNERVEEITTDIIRGRNDVRWDIECFHRELKQLTGIEKCQAQRAWSQRNHIACCYHAWIALKVYADKCKKSLYRVHSELLSNYLTAELKNPRIHAYNYA